MVFEIPLLLLAAVQVALGLLPTAWACKYCGWLRQTVTATAAVGCLTAAVALACNRWQTTPLRGPFELLDSFSFLCDGTSGLMLMLVSFIGWITCRYSIRYLDGESMQGRYFKWMSFTVGCVQCMVLAADLLTFGMLWCLTSFGLHNLLVHYAGRPAAQRAAWIKFLVSRIGDAFVLIAICLYYPIVKSLLFSDLTAAALDRNLATLPTFQLATVSLALGVLAKSAQLPFHAWLPLTMETPTPVSALMHAGIVNAGGYLLVRASPLMNASPTAQLLLVVVGTSTACIGSIVMLTQTSIKKKLAYSTISQMGFMLMQIGLGAYTAAMLHILAHSLYKAHEFLSSGSVISRRAATQTALNASRPVNWMSLVCVMLALLGLAGAMLSIVGQSPFSKPGGWLLTGLLCASITYWLAVTLAVGKRSLGLRAAGTAVLLIVVYALSFAAVDNLMGRTAVTTSEVSLLAMSVVAMVFSGLFVLQICLLSPTRGPGWRRWQVHAANGFYIESWLRRQFWSLNS